MPEIKFKFILPSQSPKQETSVEVDSMVSGMNVFNSAGRVAEFPAMSVTTAE